MSQLKRVVEPFGEVNVHPASGGKVRVVATILMEPRREGTQTGIALDGSGSMADLVDPLGSAMNLHESWASLTWMGARRHVIGRTRCAPNMIFMTNASKP